MEENGHAEWGRDGRETGIGRGGRKTFLHNFE